MRVYFERVFCAVAWICIVKLLYNSRVPFLLIRIVVHYRLLSFKFIR